MNAQGPQRKLRALLFAVLVIVLSRHLRQHRVDDLHDELLLDARQLGLHGLMLPDERSRHNLGDPA